MVVVALLACDKGRRDDARPISVAAPPAPADAQPAADAAVAIGDVAVFCAEAKAYFARVIPCAPNSADLLRSIHDDMPVDSPTAPMSARESSAALCANIAVVYDEQLSRHSDPACALSSDARARNVAFLSAYYGRRTKPRPSGNADVDKSLAQMAAARDAVCACTDMTCVRAAEKSVTAAIMHIPRELNAALEDGVSISDEVSRCAERIEMDVARNR